MKVKQISVFLENKAGRLASVTRVLGDAKINIRALCIADTADFGILRIIVDQPDRAYDALKAAGFSATETDVLAIEVPDVPGGLASVLETMGEAQVNIEYLYAFLTRASENAIIIFRVENPEMAIELLEKSNVRLLPGETVYKL
ncbi:MAG: amino acid-binding protein [Syntrophomonadaceae bacterium]|nr:amino acid-binding protein [Syntrophomonadaceae bacterium]